HRDVDDPGQLRGVGDHLVVLGDVGEQPVQVHLLLVVGAQDRRLLHSGDRQHGRVVEFGVVQAVEQVDAAGAGGGQAHPQAAGGLGVPAGHEGGGLLVVDQDETDLVPMPPQPLHDSVDAVPGQPEDGVDVPLGQPLDQHFRRDPSHGVRTIPAAGGQTPGPPPIPRSRTAPPQRSPSRGRPTAPRVPPVSAAPSPGRPVRSALVDAPPAAPPVEAAETGGTAPVLPASLGRPERRERAGRAGARGVVSMTSVPTGEFETHLTVSPVDGDREEDLGRWAAERGLKYTRILLERGRSADQPMLTFTASGSFAEQREAAARHAAELAELGWPVVRTKIEAAPWNPGVPQTDAEAVANRPDQYFEHHVKLLLDDDALERVRETARRHDAHLSRNARRRRSDGRHERFVTQRGYRIGAERAHRRLDALLAALAELGVAVLEVEREFVVLDDRLSLDEGWSTPGQTSWEASLSRLAVPGDTPVPEAGAPGFPATYQPVTDGEQARQRPVFDPATQHFDRAFRAGEPVFADPATAA